MIGLAGRNIPHNNKWFPVFYPNLRSEAGVEYECTSPSPAFASHLLSIQVFDVLYDCHLPSQTL